MKGEISLACGNAGTRYVEHYIIHLNYAGFGLLDKLISYPSTASVFRSKESERWSVSKTTESTDRVLSLVARDDRLHSEFRIAS